MIGNPELLWTSLKDYVCLFTFGHKPKISNVAILHLAQLIHCCENRPDFLQNISQITPYLNDVCIPICTT